MSKDALSDISENNIQTMPLEELVKILIAKQDTDNCQIVNNKEPEDSHLLKIQFIMVQRIIQDTDTFTPIEKIWRIIMKFYKNLTPDEQETLELLANEGEGDDLRLWNNSIEEFKKHGQKQKLN